MKYAEAQSRLAAHRKEIAAIREQMRKVQLETEPEEVADYTFQTTNGPVRLEQLFGDKNDLIVIHNMGASCRYCTLWADGYNGIYDHLADRAAFIVASPDPPEAQQKFAQSRGWRFPLVSHQGSTFAEDMGYRSPGGGWRPGVSAFRRDGDRVTRVSDTGLGPRDDFCALWHLFDLLPDGAGEWEPKYHYR